MTVVRDAYWFMKRVDASGDCWLWTGAHLPAGYGTVSWREEGRMFGMPAHRYSYQYFVGPIPDRHEVHHICGVRPCVRPSHLRTLTSTQHSHIHSGLELVA